MNLDGCVSASVYRVAIVISTLNSRTFLQFFWILQLHTSSCRYHSCTTRKRYQNKFSFTFILQYYHNTRSKPNARTHFSSCFLDRSLPSVTAFSALTLLVSFWYLSGTCSPGWSWKRAVKRVCVCVCVCSLTNLQFPDFSTFSRLVATLLCTERNRRVQCASCRKTARGSMEF